jgi:hypothetical protein
MIASSIVPTVADALDLLRAERDGEVVDGEIVVEGSSVSASAKKKIRKRDGSQEAEQEAELT